MVQEIFKDLFWFDKSNSTKSSKSLYVNLYYTWHKLLSAQYYTVQIFACFTTYIKTHDGTLNYIVNIDKQLMLSGNVEI